MSSRAAAFALALVSSSLFAANARAQDYTRRSFLVPEGELEITGTPARPELLRIDVSRDDPGTPIALSPHFYWGASDNVTLGITHRRGVCLRGCGDRPYNDAGFAILAGLTRSRAFELDLHTGLEARSFEPFFFGMRAGVIGRLTFGRAPVAFVFDPHLYAGFTERDQGNREEVVLPFWFYFQASDVVVPFFGAVVTGPLDGFGDALTVPVEAGIVFEVSENVDLGFYFRFTNLLGRDPTPDTRETGLLARFRF